MPADPVTDPPVNAAAGNSDWQLSGERGLSDYLLLKLDNALPPQVHLSEWIKGLITVEYSKDSGPGGKDGRGIYVHELLVSNYICLFLLDLSFKGGNGNWRQNLAPIVCMFAAGVLQTSPVQENEAINKKADVLTVIMCGLSAASVAYRIPYGNQPDYMSMQRYRTAGVLTFGQWVWTKTGGKVVNKVL
jgi:hypothetical protein